MLRIFSSYPEENVKSILQHWQLFLLILAGWVNRSQQDVIDYLLTEDRVLRQKLEKKRSLLNDDQRRRLADKGKILGRRMLEQLANIITPDTTYGRKIQATSNGF
jgi:putative transposase